MNERIKELKGMTLDKHFSYTWTTMDYDDMSRFAEKFAELIVKECIDCLKPLSRNHSMVGAAQDTIKEHFGIEE